MSKSIRTIVIMLSGYMQSSKDTIGNILCAKFNFSRYAFADVLKDEISSMYGFRREELDTQEGKARIVDDRGTTVRNILIRHGQQRRSENMDHWIDKIYDKIDADLSPDSAEQRIVITDWRFPNECHRLTEKLRENDQRTICMQTWRVNRWKTPPLTDITEVSLDTFPFDFVVENDKCLLALEETVKRQMYRMENLVPLILTDVDDVLLQWCQGFKTFVESHGFKVLEPHPKVWSMEQWVMRDNGQSIGKEITMQLVRRFNHSHEFGKLKPYRDAQKTLRDLKNKGYHVVAISSCTDCPEAVQKRKKNIEEYFLDMVDLVVCLPLGADKHQVLSEIKNRCIFVDDNPQNVVCAERIGHRGLLMHRPWNASFTEVSRIRSWNDVWVILNS
jgi:FMN phosphatase YigB (HAD superfamily)